jgi:hypothetical protein
MDRIRASDIVGPQLLDVQGSDRPIADERSGRFMRPRTFSLVLSILALAISSSVSNGSAASIVPAGTLLNLRTTQPIAADSAQPGMTLTGVVDDPIAVNGEVVIPRGAIAMLEVVNVERSSNLKGKDRITLTVHSIQTGSGTYPVATSQVELKGHSEGKKAARKVIGGAGIGAALGGIFGGGTGAAIGATTGGTTGAVIAGSGKTHLVVPAETLLQFQLHAAARVEP